MFAAVPANKAMAADETIYADWMTGGYYTYHFSDDFMIVGLNGMYPLYKNHVDKENSTNKMLSWFDDTLKANRDKKYITTTHVYPG